MGAILAARVSEMLLLLPHCLASWVAISPGQKGSAKCCAIGRESKGQVGDRRKGRGGPQDEIRILSPPPPRLRVARQGPVSFPSSLLLPPQSLRAQCLPPLLSSPLRGLGHGPESQVQAHGAERLHALLCAEQQQGEGKVGASFSQALHCASPHRELRGEEER